MGEFSEDKVRESGQQSGQRELRGEGQGAIGGGPKESSGAADHAGGRGTDPQAPPLREAASEAQARQGEIADETMREGWGGPGENYATAQGPNSRDEDDTSEEKSSRQSGPPTSTG